MSVLWTSDDVQSALSAATVTAPFEAEGVTFDSRAVGKGDLFFALGGETTDGHAFVADALSRGAAAAVVSRDVEGAGGPLIRVPDTMKALVELGRAARRRSAARIASVTGSVGKTSTKDALRAMLSAQAPTSASMASYNNHVGVPISLARLPQDARYGVFEIGMNHPGEIEPLARQVAAHVGIVTNVGPVHIGHMGSEEAVADEKGCLFAGMAEGAVAVLNRDSRHYERLAGKARHFGVSRIIGFGRSEAAEARLVACDLQDSGSDVAALIHGRRIEYRLGAAGEHWVLNSIGALAVVEALGADVVKAAAVLANVKASPGRGARRRLAFDGGTIELLDESYNANPVSVGRCWRSWRGPSRSRAGGGSWRWATCASWVRTRMPIMRASPMRWPRAVRRRSSCAVRTCRLCGSGSSPRSAVCTGRTRRRWQAMSPPRSGQGTWSR